MGWQHVLMIIGVVAVLTLADVVIAYIRRRK